MRERAGREERRDEEVEEREETSERRVCASFFRSICLLVSSTSAICGLRARADL